MHTYIYIYICTHVLSFYEMNFLGTLGIEPALGGWEQRCTAAFVGISRRMNFGGGGMLRDPSLGTTCGTFRLDSTAAGGFRCKGCWGGADDTSSAKINVADYTLVSSGRWAGMTHEAKYLVVREDGV